MALQNFCFIILEVPTKFVSPSLASELNFPCIFIRDQFTSFNDLPVPIQNKSLGNYLTTTAAEIEVS